MSSDRLDDILTYYQGELAWLRESGAEFARRYPKIANRLDYGGAESRDPHTERLLESFAWLTGRIQRNIDSDFPEIPTGLLNSLYPHLVAQVPSSAIAQFAVDAAQARSVQGFFVPRDTAVFAQTVGTGRDNLSCRFRTGYPVNLWPLEIADASIAPAADYDFLDLSPEIAGVLRIKLACQGRWTFADVRPASLRFFFHGHNVEGEIYELLFNQLRGIAILRDGESKPSVRLAPDALEPVGLTLDEGLLPYPANVHLGYRLIQEYFAFPAKFHFFDVTGLPQLGAQRSADLLFLLARTPARPLGITRRSFALNAVPIINLFHKTAEPVRADRTKREYLVVPDHRRERSTEIHSILKVSATSDLNDDSRVFQSYFSHDHHSTGRDPAAYWLARRQPSRRADMPGTDILLSFVDSTSAPADPPSQTVFVHTLATNRSLAEYIPPQARLEIEVDAPVSGIFCLIKPTRQIAPVIRGETLWRLVSHLSLNQLSLGDSERGVTALREILRLYASTGEANVEKQISGIRKIASRTVVRRAGSDAWRGFCRGIEIELHMDETLYTGASAFLLASVLNRFFAVYGAASSFTQLVLKSEQREGIWKQWPPLAGERHLL